MQPVPGLVGAGQTVQCGALLGGKDAAAAGSWWGGGLAAEGEARVPGGSTHREMPKPRPTCPEETRGDSPPGVTTALMHAHARTRGEQMAGSLTQCVAAEASKSVAA